MMRFINKFFGFPFNQRQRKAMIAREAHHKREFITKYHENILMIRVAELLWNELIEHHAIEGFKPDPSDDITYMFGIADEDLEDLIINISDQLSCYFNPAKIILKDEISLDELIRIITQAHQEICE